MNFYSIKELRVETKNICENVRQNGEAIITNNGKPTLLMLDIYDLIQRLQQGDILIVTKLDRFARTTAEGSKLISDLLNRGVAVHILNMGLIDNTPTGKLITHILLAFAEYERDMIIERTQAGKEIARSKNGFRDGRPPIDQKRKDFAVDLILNQHKTYREVAELTGLSKSTLIRAVNAHKANSSLKKNSLTTGLT